MSVEVWYFEHSTTGHESAGLLQLARRLDALSEHFVMILHPVLGGHELDALIFKQDMVFVVELKTARGSVTGDLYDPWMVTKEDGTTYQLNAGREDNPFWQVQKCYFAARDFLEQNKSAVMTESEAAINDFKKIKNVLIFAPDYDETASDIDLGRDYWKLNIVGLETGLADPFFTLRHDAIHLSDEQMRAFAEDVLHCRPAEDFDTLLHGTSAVDEEGSVKEAGTGEEAAATLEPETQEADFTARRVPEGDVEPPEISPAVAAPDLVTKPVQTIQKLWGGLREQVGQGKEVLQQRVEQERDRWYAKHTIDFEQLLFELRKAADSSLHHLTPDTFVANYYTVQLDAYSFEHLAQLRERYQAHAELELYRYITQQNYKLEPRYNRVAVRIERNDDLKSQISVRAEYRVVPPVVRIEGPHGLSRSLYAGDAMSIGRGESVDCRVYDEHPKPVVSREHCIVSVSDDGKSVTLRDIGSTNGTFVQGERAVFTTLEDGDTILLGRNQRDEEGPTLHVRMGI